MKKSRFTNELIAFALKQAATGTRIEEVYRKLGVSQQAFYRWKKFGDIRVRDLRKPKFLEKENRRHQALVADLSLVKQTLQGVLSTKLYSLLALENQWKAQINALVVLKTEGNRY